MRRGGSRRVRGSAAGRLRICLCRRRYRRRGLVGACSGNAEEHRHDRKTSHGRTPCLVRLSACLRVRPRSVDLCSWHGQRLVAARPSTGNHKCRLRARCHPERSACPERSRREGALLRPQRPLATLGVTVTTHSSAIALNLRRSVPIGTCATSESAYELPARVQRREGCLMRRNPISVSALWLFLLSSLARRNGLLSLSLRSRRKQRS